MLVVNLDLGRHCNTPCLEPGGFVDGKRSRMSRMSRVTSHFFGGFGNGRVGILGENR